MSEGKRKREQQQEDVVLGYSEQMNDGGFVEDGEGTETWLCASRYRIRLRPASYQT